MKSHRPLLACGMLLLTSAAACPRGEPDVNEMGVLDSVLAEGKRDAGQRIRKDPALTALAARYPLVVLHSRRSPLHLDPTGSYLRSAYSFVHETADPKKHRGDVQLLFDNRGDKGTFDINLLVYQQNLVADLGEVDFTKDHDPESVDLDGEGQNTWLYYDCQAKEGHVYLERVRDSRGSRFYVLFKVVAVDKDARYLAFLWRRLPGGKVVK